MRLKALLVGLLLFGAQAARAEDGYDLWLRYKPLPEAQRPLPREIRPSADTPTLKVARTELERGLEGLFDLAPGQRFPSHAPVILLGTPTSSREIASLKWSLKDLGEEGYLIRTVGKAPTVTVITANSDIGVLYGVFHYLRLIQTGQNIENLDIPFPPERHVEPGGVPLDCPGRQLFLSPLLERPAQILQHHPQIPIA